MKDFEPQIFRRALARQVLAVAKTRINGPNEGDIAWACYLDAVPGQNHDNEWQEVARVGVKQPEELARLLFPRIDLPYAP